MIDLARIDPATLPQQSHLRGRIALARLQASRPPRSPIRTTGLLDGPTAHAYANAIQQTGRYWCTCHADFSGVVLEVRSRTRPYPLVPGGRCLTVEQARLFGTCDHTATSYLRTLRDQGIPALVALRRTRDSGYTIGNSRARKLWKEA